MSAFRITVVYSGVEAFLHTEIDLDLHTRCSAVVDEANASTYSRRDRAERYADAARRAGFEDVQIVEVES